MGPSILRAYGCSILPNLPLTNRWGRESFPMGTYPEGKEGFNLSSIIRWEPGKEGFK
jgi:hypothetical protein